MPKNSARRLAAEGSSGGENKPFSGFKCQYLENGSRYGQSCYLTK